ncbi:MAG: hypothetical protein ACYTF2_07450 [Planctomycetota bacterium]|jgi:hypothetical protein
MLARRIPWLLAAVGLFTGGVSPQTPPAEEPPPPRVVVLVNRNLEVGGHVVLEDADVIIVRTPDSRIESFPKTRVLKIVRLVEPEPGQTGVVILRNGQQREGIVLEDAFDHVLLDIDGIQARLPRETVDHVILEPTFAERYQQYKTALGENQPQRHLDLCNWLMSERQYELARTELLELLATEPLPEAQRLLNVVEAQLALREKPAGSGPDDPGPPAGARDEPPGELLTHEDVNLIRVYEIDFDRPPKVSVEAETIRAMIEQYSASRLIPGTESERHQLYRADPIEIVELLFKLRARDLYPQVNVITEPWALNLFRRRIHNTWLLNNCATVRCHGGGPAGRFYLHRHRYRDERVRYTNLLILHRMNLDPNWLLVNYDEPAMSLIVQYGLPRQQARKPHPDVKGWKPVFGPGGQRMLHDTISWIDAMMKPRPKYPVDFEAPPLGGAAEDPPPLPVRDTDRTPR